MHRVFEENIRRNLDNFLREFRKVIESTGRSRENIEILFAVKYLNPYQFMQFMYTCQESFSGNVLIGENRVQSMEEKVEFLIRKDSSLLDQFKSVMIGSLQKNKINKALEIFSEIHSVDSSELAKNINSRASNVIPVYLEVNISGEVAKHGFNIEDVEKTLGEFKTYTNLKVKGLMTMAPFTQDQDKIRSVFKKLKEIASEHNLLTSMGMSNDWKIAVEQGSDMVRIGSAVFLDGG
jgi:hypothetical protein